MKPLNHDYHEIDKEFLIYDDSIAKNNHNPTKINDIELITITPNSYTSLRDIIAASSAANAALAGANSPSTAPASPTTTRKSSNRDDVPIRNPLVKHAALAYLQPFSSPTTEIDGRSWPEKMKANLNSCFAGDAEEGELGCMAPLDGVVLTPIKEIFGRFLRAISTMERREDHED